MGPFVITIPPASADRYRSCGAVLWFVEVK